MRDLATHTTYTTRLLATLQTHAILFASAFMVVVAAGYGMVPHT